MKVGGPRAHRRAIALMIVRATLWSIAGVVTRHLESAGRWEVTFWRSLFAAASCSPRCSPRAAAAPGRSARHGRLRACSPARCGRSCSSPSCCADDHHHRHTLIVNSIAPLLTALLARAVLREPIAPRTWAAIALAIAGMLWMFGSGFAGGEPRHAAGMLIALAVPLAAAVNLVTLKHAGVRGSHSGRAAGAIFSAILTLPFALLSAPAPTTFSCSRCSDACNSACPAC